MTGSAEVLTYNPEDEPYHDGVFEDFHILIVCLYMGANEANNRITRSIFGAQCGAVLERKGFSYTFVCSYGEALTELERNKNGHCPYTQLWLFSSEGYGDLPTEARDKDNTKIIASLKAIEDFWRNGGGLLLFCDNHPYNFEANLLLETFSFPDEKKSSKTKVRMGGEYAGGGKIRVASSEMPTRGGFSPRSSLTLPGQGDHRLSLRPGLVEIYEGDTISYAVDESGRSISDPKDLWPFTPFAWSTENVTPPRSFILHYDPGIPSETAVSPGPIVLHGGFTSAFYEFGSDRLGTGRLIVSIACWLVRVEERLVTSIRESKPLVTWTPKLSGRYRFGLSFPVWRTLLRWHSILVLDGSGSMSESYDELTFAANEYIRIQTQDQGLISVVCFGSRATVLYTLGTRYLEPREGFTKRNTNFVAALDAAIPLLQETPPGYKSRIVFFTDGNPVPNVFPTRQIEQIRSMNIRLDPIGYGRANVDVMNQLACCGGDVTMGKNMNDVIEAFRRKAATSHRRAQ
jgi:hypothetical protein